MIPLAVLRPADCKTASAVKEKNMKVKMTVTERRGKCGKDFRVGDTIVLGSEEDIARFCPNAHTVGELKEKIAAAAASGEAKTFTYECYDHAVTMDITVEP